jgi:hypothetical protein
MDPAASVHPSSSSRSRGLIRTSVACIVAFGARSGTVTASLQPKCPRSVADLAWDRPRLAAIMHLPAAKPVAWIAVEFGVRKQCGIPSWPLDLDDVDTARRADSRHVKSAPRMVWKT